MQIDIRKIPVYWITIEPATERHLRMKSLFDICGFENTIRINGELMDKSNKDFMEIQKEKGHLVAKAHSEALTNSGPILILEDDVWYTENFDPIVEVEEDVDAVYMGTSVWGMVDGVSTGGGTTFDVIDEDFIKPMNMLGVHSVLYLSDSYKKTTTNNMLNAKDMGLIMDEPVAMDMKNHNIMCYADPRFYQKDGHNNQVTSIPLRITA